MEILKTRSYSRAGLIGNPSDGYHGKTISIIVKNFYAQVVMYEWDEIEVIPTIQDQCRFKNLDSLVSDIKLNGYYGGMRLVKSAIKRFCDYCNETGINLDNKKFSLRYESNIPRQVGLAGSSAIVTAVIKALCKFYNVEIDKKIMPNIALTAETKELGIGAGLQDRVSQIFEGLTYMDFNKPFMDKHGYGVYEPLPVETLPNLYIAYQTNLAEGSEVFHNNIRQRYDSGEKLVVDAMATCAELAFEARQALLEKDYQKLASLMNKNFDARRAIYNLNPRHIRMVELARELGASSQFAGSGGAVIGTYEDEKMYGKLKAAYENEDCAVIKPIVE